MIRHIWKYFDNKKEIFENDLIDNCYSCWFNHLIKRVMFKFANFRPHYLTQAHLAVCLHHSLSQQGVWVPFWTPKPLKRTPQDTQFVLGGISKNLNLKLIIEFFHHHIIPMILFNDIMPYFDEFIHVYG